jgi:hypothetical protein
MSPFSNPKLAEIVEGVAELEPIFDKFGCASGFALQRSIEGSF